MKTRVGPILACLMFMMAMLAACAQPETVSPASSSAQTEAAPTADEQPETPAAAQEPVKLAFSSNAKDSTNEAYKSIAEQFNQEYPHITVEVTGVPKDFEALMNAKMAAGDLPDLWTTHGWSVRKYSEYLRPLNDQSWTGSLVEEIVPIISDEQGNLFVLPLDVDLSGMIYNAALLEELQLDVPHTWPQFLETAETIKQAGYTPIHIGGKDTSDVAGLLGRLSASLLIADEQAGFAGQLTDGTFEWSAFDKVSSFLLDLRDNGYLNKDYITADKAATYQAFAENKAAFAFQSNQSIYEILKLNPDARVSMMRIPVGEGSGEPFLISGERDAVGVWKDTQHEEEALLFLEFLSRPEHVSAIAETYSLPAAIQDVDVELGELKDVFAQFESARVMNHFDRQYLPGGMWNTLKAVGPGLLSGDLNPQQASQAMKEDYDRLRQAESGA
ncbi:ABC transporter substrate-binding protein [Paenibacillus sp. 1P07SE]|uniref:ABC transporter substrate-binding protein n=1 Tax=Paenibacillus sp. 1P07SE TaxID=3132209 RepID=UPI0039A6BD52